jgi:carboxymethylenebutenolidase
MHSPELPTGFAPAVGPVSAATIATDTEGLDAGAVRIPTPGGAIPGYRARPASGDAFPVALVVHEIFGVHEHIKDVCRRLAKQGYLVCGF